MKYILLGLLFFTLGCEVSNTPKQQVENSPTNTANTPLPNLEANQYRHINLSNIQDSESLNRKAFTGFQINWDLLTPILDEAKLNQSNDLVAVFGAITDEGFYIHHEQVLGFSPAAMEQANGNTRKFYYEFGLLDSDSVFVQRVAIAYIPDSDLAYSELFTWVQPIKSSETDSLNLKITTGRSCYLYTMCRWSLARIKVSRPIIINR